VLLAVLGAACADDDTDGPLTAAEVIDELDCVKNPEDIPGLRGDNHECPLEDTFVRLHVFGSAESQQRAMEILDDRGPPIGCPDGSYATYVAVEGPDWVAVAYDGVTANAVAQRTGGQVVPVAEGAGVPVSYYLPEGASPGCPPG
jgi:hypothetical protein